MVNEVRLIDANAFIETIEKIASEDKTPFFHLDEITQEIFDAPTIDPETLRKKGRWNSLTECSNAGVYCSVCHKKVWKEDYTWCNRKNRIRSNYCPNCGADMREG